MEVLLGTAGLDATFQEPFGEVITCVHCKGPTRIAFVAAETFIVAESQKDPVYVCDLHPNEKSRGGAYWVHDAMATAVYLCEKCCGATAVYNQA